MSTPKPFLHPLPYYENSAERFASFLQTPWAILLDSAHPLSKSGRYDIFACDPLITLVTDGNLTRISRNGTYSEHSDNPFTLLKRCLSEFHDIAISEVPFRGGALGYFSYDLARRLERLPDIARAEEYIPDMAIGIYLWAIIVDHEEKRCWIAGQDHPNFELNTWLEKFQSSPQSISTENFKIDGSICSNMSPESYATAFNKIKHYLIEGDCYQINLTQRFEAPCHGNSWQAYLRLRELNAAPFSCFFRLEDAEILCSSPERFLQVIDGRVETKPIKGTRPRKYNVEANAALMYDLQTSVKDRAENVMIVDLLRNDLSKTCRTGSVKVPHLFDVESYTTVHHLVSTVTGELAEDAQAIDLLRDCFPGGSITGAPKIRAMEIIEELEPHRRGVYCGSIGYIGFNGRMDTNIAIRTLVRSGTSIRCYAGGGIVHDSILKEEYQESFDKAAAMLRVLEEFKV